MEKNILICDDDEDILYLISMLMEDMGHQATGITDSRKVMDLVRSMKPDLLILDVWMPFKSGFDVLDELSADEEVSLTKVLLLSAAEEAKLNKLADYPNDTFLAKPFDIEILEETVAKLLQEK